MTSPKLPPTKTYDLGQLEKLPIRQVWNWEAHDFTPWLSQNLDLLGKVLEIDLEFEGSEKRVGPFRADILCRDTATGHWVLIENQFDKTDHTHLGQLITYAAGLEAVTIVWVAERFTEEHRAALDWLNRVTAEGVNFFGLEVELWRIGDSKPAPKFNVVSQPNDWAKTVALSAQEELSETAMQQLEFWQKFHAYVSENSKVIRPQKANGTHWMDFSVGRSGFFLGARINTLKKVMTVGLYINHEAAKPMFSTLLAQKEEIENTFGMALNWVENPTKKQSKIEVTLSPADLAEQEQWPQQQRWMLEQLEQFHQAFSHRIRQLTSTYPEDEL